MCAVIFFGGVWMDAAIAAVTGLAAGLVDWALIRAGGKATVLLDVLVGISVRGPALARGCLGVRRSPEHSNCGACSPFAPSPPTLLRPPSSDRRHRWAVVQVRRAFLPPGRVFGNPLLVRSLSRHSMAA